VSKTASVNQFAKWAKQRLASRSLDVLINNAGGALGLDTVAEGKDSDWETMMQTNVLGVLRVTRAGAAIDRTQSPARVSSTSGRMLRGRSMRAGAAYCGGQGGRVADQPRVAIGIERAPVCASVPVDPGLARTEFPWCVSKSDKARAEKPYEGTIPLVAEDIAEILVWVASRPSHVNIDEMLIKPTDQAAMHKVYRRTK